MEHRFGEDITNIVYGIRQKKAILQLKANKIAFVMYWFKEVTTSIKNLLNHCKLKFQRLLFLYP